jgi:hypothetical protein
MEGFGKNFETLEEDKRRKGMKKTKKGETATIKCANEMSEKGTQWKEYMVTKV